MRYPDPQSVRPRPAEDVVPDYCLRSYSSVNLDERQRAVIYHSVKLTAFDNDGAGHVIPITAILVSLQIYVGSAPLEDTANNLQRVDMCQIRRPDKSLRIVAAEREILQAHLGIVGQAKDIIASVGRIDDGPRMLTAHNRQLQGQRDGAIDLILAWRQHYRIARFGCSNGILNTALSAVTNM